MLGERDADVFDGHDKMNGSEIEKMYLLLLPTLPLELPSLSSRPPAVASSSPTTPS